MSDKAEENLRGLPFAARLKANAPLVGSFVKTTGHQTIEVMAHTAIDFALIDAEHAPFDRHGLDIALLAAQGKSLPALVRLPNANAESILHVLDCGATGIVVPHVDSVEKAQKVALAARYRNGTRGFSNSPRAGGYGSHGMAEHIRFSDEQVVVICQIETAAAVEAVDAIAGVPGVDCLFIGRADLAVSYGVDTLDHPLVEQAVSTICSAGGNAGITVGMFLPDTTSIARYWTMGVRLFVIGSDQSLLQRAVGVLLHDARQEMHDNE
jgi:2-keto-3-deoxy-L-rhamnonate aldolase RhmA